jgi:hypothetical protein
MAKSKNPSQYFVIPGLKKVIVKVGSQMYIPSILKLSVLGVAVALLLTEYWYTPGKVPVTVSVLR